MSEFKYQVLVEIATGIARAGGFTDLEADPALDLTKFRVDKYLDQPADVVITPFPDHAKIVEAARGTMAIKYNSGPLNLQILFAPVMSQVFSALELGNYLLAKSLAEGVDTSVVADLELRAQADALKAELVTDLTQLVQG